MSGIILNGYPDDFNNDVFLPYIKNESRYLIFYGGAGSGKSRFIAQKILHRTLFEDVNHRFLIIRKTQPALRKSCFALIKDYISSWQLNNVFNVRETDMSFEYTVNGNQILSVGLDDVEKLKSIERITGVWIEEATEITYNDFTQIDLRLRGNVQSYKQIILSFNPIDVHSWINRIFFESCKKNTTICHSTVDDNQFIDKDYKEVLDSLSGEDENLYNIYRLGKWGVLKNVIYSNYDIIDYWPDNFDEVIYGLDFGFNNPSALIEIGIKDQQIFERELLYESGLTNSQLIDRLEKFNINKTDNIYGDCAEPARIEEIRQSGFNIFDSNKSVKDGIDYVKRHKVLIYNSPNHIKEKKAYKYKEDKNGNVFDEPVKFMDHLQDAERYAIYTHSLSGPAAACYGNEPEEINYRRFGGMR